ncbi:hypothetical protein B0T22DRAFT_376041 [Podospora appendiculata]|uniref:ATP-grasp domain-containing protein n=1 Tax=Podospora appendiculata TaxID=314037 RepID=A0AAE0XA52_9PEZI|nr:hypothetical protein B0T22DRAFT_376041 [Podospora appendiculata]
MHTYQKGIVAAAKILPILGLNLFCLTFSLLVAVANLLLRKADVIGLDNRAHRESCRTAPGFRQRTILITEVGTARGLTLARSFYLCGHRVIGVDSHRFSPGRFSRALTSFHRLRLPALHSVTNSAATTPALRRYARSFVELLRDEQVDIWVSCAGDELAFASSRVKELVEARNSRCKCIMIDSDMVSDLLNSIRFFEHASRIGLPVPETHEVMSREQVASHVLDDAQRHWQRDTLGLGPRGFILKPSNTTDVYNPDTINEESYDMRKFLTGKDDLKTHLEKNGRFARKDATEAWVLQQYLRPIVRFRTHAFVIRGRVAVFIASPVSEQSLAMRHYFAESPESDTHAQMLQFTKDFASRSRPGPANEPLTGHLSFEFMVVDERSPAGRLTLYAYSGSPCVRTSVVMMSTPGPQMRAMVAAYLSVLDEPQRGSHRFRVVANNSKLHLPLVTPPPNPYRRYRGGHHVLNLVIRQVWGYFAKERPKPVQDALRKEIAACLGGFRTDKEATFEVWDPVPFLVYHHLQWTCEVVRDIFSRVLASGPSCEQPYVNILTAP